MFVTMSAYLEVGYVYFFGKIHFSRDVYIKQRTT